MVSPKKEEHGSRSSSQQKTENRKKDHYSRLRKIKNVNVLETMNKAIKKRKIKKRKKKGIPPFRVGGQNRWR